MDYYVYEITCATPGHRYVGVTRQLGQRIREHAGLSTRHRGAAFVRKHRFRSYKVVGKFPDEASAKRVEWEHVQLLDAEGLTVRGAGRTQRI